MEVAATAQQGAVTPGAQSDWQAAAETVVEGSEDWQMMGNAGVEAVAAAAGGAAEYGPGGALAANGRKKGKTRAKHRPGDQRHRNKEQGR